MFQDVFNQDFFRASSPHNWQQKYAAHQTHDAFRVQAAHQLWESTKALREKNPREQHERIIWVQCIQQFQSHLASRGLSTQQPAICPAAEESTSDSESHSSDESKENSPGAAGDTRHREGTITREDPEAQEITPTEIKESEETKSGPEGDMETTNHKRKSTDTHQPGSKKSRPTT